MELLPETPVFEFNNNTLNLVRKQYGLEDKKILEDSIDHLVEWIKKQDHFMRKDFSREYLERTIILSKGSLEKSKLKLDKICTFRTLLPIYFQTIDIENCQLLKDVKIFFLPKMTKDHYRVYMLKNIGQRFDHGLLDLYRHAVRTCEYIQAHDYFTGVITVFDYTELNLMEFLKALNLVELQQIFSMVIHGYGMRLKGLHFITSSKGIDILIGLIKQVVSSKIGDRIKVHKSIEGIYDHIPKEMLPSNYGGKEKSIDELQLNMKKALFSTNFNEYFNYMNGARTNEAFRSEENFNNECMGMPGSFRKLNVD